MFRGIFVFCELTTEPQENITMAKTNGMVYFLSIVKFLSQLIMKELAAVQAARPSYDITIAKPRKFQMHCFCYFKVTNEMSHIKRGFSHIPQRQ